MKIANLSGRATIITERGGIDVALSSDGRFSTSVDELLGELDALREWLEREQPEADPKFKEAELQSNLEILGPPITRPCQIFAVGLNYAAHADEVEMARPEQPMIFTKFASALTGPGAAIPLPNNTVDWEVEMVAVVGKGGRDISQADALEHVAGYCVGQDISERSLQMATNPPQFSLAKSYQGFAPIGPWLTTADEITDPQSLDIECHINDELMQASNTALMLFNLTDLISYLSSVCALFPGDLIFTGTPNGVGFRRDPPRFLRSGECLASRIGQLGELRNRAE